MLSVGGRELITSASIRCSQRSFTGCKISVIQLPLHRVKTRNVWNDFLSDKIWSGGREDDSKCESNRKSRLSAISQVVKIRKRLRNAFGRTQKKRKAMEMNSGIYYLNSSIGLVEETYVNGSVMEYFNATATPDVNTTQMPYTPYTERLATYIIPIIFALIFIIGVLGNGCLILIFFRHRAMRNVPNT